MIEALLDLMTVTARAEAAAADAGAAAADGAAAAGAGMQLVSMLLSMVVLFVVFYFFMIRPQRKKEKKTKEMLDALKKGDRICTIGGIYGTIVSIKDDTITLAVGSQRSEMVVARWAIRSVEDVSVENEGELLN